MNSKAGVIIGLVIALVVLTVPFWYALGQRVTGRSQPAPEIALPTAEDMGCPEKDRHCVEDNMRARHMQVIDEWRDAVVRDGITEEYESQDHPGSSYVRSLTKTCLLQCHASAEPDSTVSVQQRFCNECHQYANIRPNCWDCHLEGSP
jgi:hypothetical protein